MIDTKPWTGACCPCPFDREKPDVRAWPPRAPPLLRHHTPTRLASLQPPEPNLLQVCPQGGQAPSDKLRAIMEGQKPVNADVRRRLGSRARRMVCAYMPHV